MRTRAVAPVVALLAFGAGAARAEQVVLFDITYTHTNANDSHHGISGAMLTQPANWTAPINYAQGTIHFYQEVMTKPSNKETIIDVCLISGRGYGCIETLIYTTTGVVHTMRSMAGRDVYQRNQIDFNQRMRSIQLVLKTPAPTFINGGRPQSDFLPSKMRFVATLVSPGGTYLPPTPSAGFDAGVPMAGDAGASDAPVEAGAVADAVAPPEVAPVVDTGVSPPPVDAGNTTPPSTNMPPPPPTQDAGKPASPPPSAPPAEPDPSGAPGWCSLGGGRADRSGWATLALLVAAFAALRARRR